MENTDHPLLSRLPPIGQTLDTNGVFDRFLDYATARGVELYAAQEEALLEICADKNVILGTPTGSGKSLVAEAMHFLAMARGQRSVYTSPIKALVNEKFFALCNLFHPDNVGLLTGDATVNRDAPILCCTAEVLANWSLTEGKKTDVSFAILDEFHYYSDRDRGVAWQVPLLTLPNTTFLLMSATLGDPKVFAEKLTELNGKPTAMVLSMGEIRHPQGERTEVRLTHFVIDGHHKLLAAAQTGKPLTLLSFFAHDHSRIPIDRFHTRHPDEYVTERLADVEVERLWLEQQRRLYDLDSPS